MPTDNEYLRLILNTLSSPPTASPSPSPSPAPAPSGVMVAPSENHIGEVGGNLGESSISFARPSDTVPYSTGDSVSLAAGTVLQITNLARIVGGAGYISKAIAFTNQKTMPGRLRLHLYNFASIGATADNQPLVLPPAAIGNYQGWIDFTTFVTTPAVGTTMAMSIGQLGTLTSMPFRAEASTRSLYALVESLNDWPPAAFQQFSFYLTGDRY